MTRPKIHPSIPAVALTSEHAAAALDMGDTFFRDNVAPDLRCIRIKGKVLYPVTEIERWATDKAEFTIGGSE